MPRVKTRVKTRVPKSAVDDACAAVKSVLETKELKQVLGGTGSRDRDTKVINFGRKISGLSVNFRCDVLESGHSLSFILYSEYPPSIDTVVGRWLLHQLAQSEWEKDCQTALDEERPKSDRKHEGFVFRHDFDNLDFSNTEPWKQSVRDWVLAFTKKLKGIPKTTSDDIRKFNNQEENKSGVSDYVRHLLVETTASGPHSRTEVFSDLKNKFGEWLQKRVKTPETPDRYVTRVEALDGPERSRQDTDPWYGLMVLLTGKNPDPIGTVFTMQSSKAFLDHYNDVLSLISCDINEKEQRKADYPSCTQFDTIFEDLRKGVDHPDGGWTRAALNNYIKFLKDLENLVDDGSGSAEGDTKSPDPQKEQDKISKLSEVLGKALSKCEKVHEFQSVDLHAFLRERQKIWFGAPGTGKSFKVNELAKCLENNGGRCFRTTFHPDYDYATFVGCYKPAPAKDNAKEITYEFVPQVFTKAYVAAWEYWMSDEPKPVVLVIEEINRGNCAQIFGQIFQLLDRNDSGYSEYPVTMDQDLLRYLLGLQDSKIKDASYEVGGKPVPLITENEWNEEEGVLVLPPNFFIFATMNTSDQSLFPMDSAFKRRWGWEYVPIDCSGKPENWNIKIGNKQYSWKVFLDNINQKILEKLKSPDKQLGERFVKADEGGIIDQKTFVNKIMFYLIGDAFKDDSTIREICKGDSYDKTEIVFADFADETKVKVDGKDQTKGEANLEKFFRSLGVKPILHP